MEYTALYRKYRPNGFDSVCGQEHIVTTLKNQIKYNRIAHAYLFCGIRGTGKTTLARIFAAAVNCTGNDEKPCGHCKNCEDFFHNRSLNVIELDAASNNGVDDVRSLIEQTEYSPVDAKYKIYIIDEAHMLSGSAENALLKTLEEPPEYVIFILATTEPNKIKETIRSRCQKYEFHQITGEVIKGQIKKISELEGIEIDDDGVDYIAGVADGSMRDALSIFDSCFSFCLDNKKIDLKDVTDMLGTADYTAYRDLILSLINKNSVGVLKIINELSKKGADYQRIVSDFLLYLRNVMIIKADSSLSDVLGISKSVVQSINEVVTIMEMPVILEYIKILSALQQRIKTSTIKRIELESTLLLICENGKSSLSDEKLKTVQQDIRMTEKNQPVEVKRPIEAEQPVEIKQPVEAEPVISIDDISKNASGLTKAMLTKIKLNIKDKKIIFIADNDLTREYFEKDSIKSEIRNILSKLGITGYNVGCELTSVPKKVYTKEEKEDIIKNNIKNIDITWED